jgi:hypothetical protein
MLRLMLTQLENQDDQPFQYAQVDIVANVTRRHSPALSKMAPKGSKPVASRVSTTHVTRQKPCSRLAWAAFKIDYVKRSHSLHQFQTSLALHPSAMDVVGLIRYLEWLAAGPLHVAREGNANPHTDDVPSCDDGNVSSEVSEQHSFCRSRVSRLNLSWETCSPYWHSQGTRSHVLIEDVGRNDQ